MLDVTDKTVKFKNECLLAPCSLKLVTEGIQDLVAHHVKFTIDSHLMILTRFICSTLESHLGVPTEVVSKLEASALVVMCTPHLPSELADSPEVVPSAVVNVRFKVTVPVVCELLLNLDQRIAWILNLFCAVLVPLMAAGGDRARAYFVHFCSLMETRLEELQESLDEVPDELRQFLATVRTLIGGCADTPTQTHLQALDSAFLLYSRRVACPQADVITAVMGHEVHKNRIVFVTGNSAAIQHVIGNMESHKAMFERSNRFGVTIESWDVAILFVCYRRALQCFKLKCFET